MSMRAFWFFIGIVTLALIMFMLPFMVGCATPEPERWECCEDTWGVPFCFEVDEDFAKNRNMYSSAELENHDRASDTCYSKRKR